MITERSKKPEAGAEISFNLPEIKTFFLDNGLKVVFVEKKNLPIIQYNLIVNAGSVFDPPGKEGVANLTGMLLDEGADDLDALELDDAVESLGSILEISTDHDTTFISMLSLIEKFDESLSLFSKVIKSPHLKEDDFIREKSRLLARILQLTDEPSYIANINFDKVIFDGSNYVHPSIGFADSIDNINLDDIKNHYKKYFAPSNSTMVVVGNISQTELQKKLNRGLNSWSGPDRITRKIEKQSPAKQKVIIINKNEASQSEIRVGLPVSGRSDLDYFPRLLLNSILGGQFSSRINLNLREDKGYTYGAQSAFSYNNFLGSFKVATSVDSKNTGNAINEILFELKNIKKEIFEHELEFAQSNQVRKYPAMFETYTQIARNLNTYVVFGLDENYFNSYIENIKSVNLTDLDKAAEDCIKTESLTVLVVGDKDELLPQLEKIFGDEITIIN